MVNKGKCSKGKRKTDKDKSKDCVIIPYVKGLLEILVRVMKKHGISSSIRPHYTQRKTLVHPKDKVKEENICGVVFEVSCHNCELKYIGKTGRKFNRGLSEYPKDAKTVPLVFTGSEEKSYETCFNKYAVTDHIAKANHVID